MRARAAAETDPWLDGTADFKGTSDEVGWAPRDGVTHRPQCQVPRDATCNAVLSQ
jgi:hypothetical protein